MRADRLSRLAAAAQVTEDTVIERALDLLFALHDRFGDKDERWDWSLLSAESLHRVWDNEHDAAYDNWKELYGLPAR